MSLSLPAPLPPNLEFERPADRERLLRVVAALEGRGVQALVANDAAHARQLVLERVPGGAEVHVALSETMRVLGVTAEIETSGRYDAVRPRLAKMDRATRKSEMRKLASAPDYILGSVHAVTDDGRLLVASGTGSQLGPYAHSAGRVILAVGHQKVVRDLDEGLRRIREYCFPREFERMKQAGRGGTVIGKILIVEAEFAKRITVVLVPETLGF